MNTDQRLQTLRILATLDRPQPLARAIEAEKLTALFMAVLRVHSRTDPPLIIYIHPAAPRGVAFASFAERDRFHADVQAGGFAEAVLLAVKRRERARLDNEEEQ